MSNPYATFQRFNDLALAKDMEEWLRQQGIDSKLENNQKYFNPDFAFNKLDADILIKISPENFDRANQALDDYYRQRLKNVDAGYYLFDFSTSELHEIISKPDEWGHFDFQLAQKILKDRGEEINPATISELKKDRLKQLAKPEKASVAWILAAYFMAIFGGFIGAFMGYLLAFSKNTLPDGSRVYSYPPPDRMHGRIIFVIGLSGFLIWILTRLSFATWVFANLFS